MDELQKLSIAERRLAITTDPKESYKIEAMAAAARAWAKEQKDYETVVAAGRMYILAKRKTTELIAPEIKWGGDRKSKNQVVVNNNLIPDEITPEQWRIRKKLLEIEEPVLEDYINYCIETELEPTTGGLIRYYNTDYSGSPDELKDTEPRTSEASNLAITWQVETGQVWKLGNSRLVCGDSLNPEIAWKAIQGQKIQMILNDPPYGMALDTDYSKMPSTRPEGNIAHQPLAGDDRPFEYNNLGLECQEEFWFGADYYRKTLPDGGSWLVWDKRVEDKFDAMIGSAFELIWSKRKHKREIIRCNNTLFSGSPEAKNKLHPTVKPTAVIKWILERYSNRDDTVLDMYSGAGTTLICCEQMRRKCIAIEIEPMYVAVALQRYLDATGIQPALEE